MLRSLIFLLLFLIFRDGISQSPSPYKILPVSKKDFGLCANSNQDSCDALVLFDIGSSEFLVNDYGEFTLVFKKHTRVLIKSRRAFELATIEIPLYKNIATNKEETVAEFETSLYKLAGDSVQFVKDSIPQLLLDRFSKQLTIQKYTYPGLTEGCIIEFSYVLKSPFYSKLRSWRFQHNYPCLWSEYSVNIPPMFGYLTLKKGDLPFTYENGKQSPMELSKVSQADLYNLQIRYSIKGESKFGFWAMENIPAYRQETFVSSMANYRQRIDFALESVNYAKGFTRIIRDWKSTAASLLADDDFGADIKKNNNDFVPIIKKISTELDSLDKAKAIYEFIKQNFSLKGNEGDIYLSQPIKETFEKKSGNVTDLNMLLVAMLNKAGFNSSPVILSTKSKGVADSRYAILSQYDYVICMVSVNNEKYLLDASAKNLPFGKLLHDCYNQSAVIISETPDIINLSPDSLHELSSVTIELKWDGRNKLSGLGKTLMSDYESEIFRSEKPDLALKVMSEEIQKALSPEFELSSFFSDPAETSADYPVTLLQKIAYQWPDQNQVYFSPAFYLPLSKNPFPYSKRIHPVELPYPFCLVYNLVMDIPDSYIIEDTPKNIKLKLNNVDGIFEYLIIKEEKRIIFRSMIKLNKASFDAEEYEALRDFYALAWKKFAEPLVFTKKK